MNSSPNRIDILEVLNSTKSQTYLELKSLSGFKSKKVSGKFAYHLRKLLRGHYAYSKRYPWVALNKSDRKYRITGTGRVVLCLARYIEEK